MLNSEEWAEVNEMRANFYEFLASIYQYELTEDQIQSLAVQRFALDDDYVGEGYSLMKEYLRHRDSGTRQQLAVDYARVFLGAGMYEQRMAPPFESVYTSEDHLLMQDARDDVVALYAQEELGLPAENTTPEDHVSFEFQFMAKLIRRAQEASVAEDTSRLAALEEKQRRFFAEHLVNWVPQLCNDVSFLAETEFYRGVAAVTKGFLQLESDLIAEFDCAA